jgi:serine protease
VLASGGRYPYAFRDVPEGRYLLIAGSDMDNDRLICDAGEACGAYPTLDTVVEIEVAGSLSGLDFLSGFNGILSVASSQWPASAAAAPPRGFSRQVGGRAAR